MGLTELITDSTSCDDAWITTCQFTERHWANALLAPVIEYEVTGVASALNHARQGIDALHYMQNNPVNGNPVNGCFNHYPEGSQQLGFSPWMSSLMAHALLRAYHTLGDERIPGMLAALGQCEVDRGVYFPSEPNEPQYRMPYYIAYSYGPVGVDPNDYDPWSDYEHAIDVAYAIALGAYFAGDGAQVGELTTAVQELLKTHAYDLSEWTRRDGWPENGRPLYRVNPPRKYGWWYKNTGAIGWALGGATRMPQIYPNRPALCLPLILK